MKIGPGSARFATILQILSVSGMVLLLSAFVIYMLDVIPSAVPPERVSELWHLSSEAFAKETDSPLGWHWVATIATGSGLALASLVYLAIGSIIGMLVLVPVYARRKNTAYLVIVIAEAAVLCLAASGILIAN